MASLEDAQQLLADVAQGHTYSAVPGFRFARPHRPRARPVLAAVAPTWPPLMLWVNMADRSLEEILTELSEVQDALIEAAPDDFATRAELSNRQDTLRLQAREARSEISDDLSAEQLEREVERLEDELLRYLDTRPSASAGHGGGGRGGGGIDPWYLHEMHRKMDASFGFEEKKERLRTLKVRPTELSGRSL